MLKCLESILQNQDFILYLNQNDIHLDCNIFELNRIDHLETLISKFQGLNYLPEIDLLDQNQLLYLKENKWDFIISNDVFEHIPNSLLTQILYNLKQLGTAKTIQIHIIDTSDHFSHLNQLIDEKNFLNYNQFFWNILTSNRFIYQNRLQKSDYVQIFKSLKFEIFENVNLDNCSIDNNLYNLQYHNLDDLIAKRVFFVLKNT
jgi:hypothetical protein